MAKQAAIALLIALTVVLFGGCLDVPGLASKLRRRLRALLEDRGEPQIALARSIDLSKSQMSRILKYDEHAGAVTVRALERLGTYLKIPAPDLLRDGDEEVISLSERERDVIELFRLLAPEQQLNLLSLLDYVFKPRREAAAERRQLAILRQNIERQIAPHKMAR